MTKNDSNLTKMTKMTETKMTKLTKMASKMSKSGPKSLTPQTFGNAARCRRLQQCRGCHQVFNAAGRSPTNI